MTNAFSSGIVQAEFSDKPRFLWLSHSVAFAAGLAIAAVASLFVLGWVTYGLTREAEFETAIAHQKGFDKGHEEGFQKCLKEGAPLAVKDAVFNDGFEAGFRKGNDAGVEETADKVSEMLPQTLTDGFQLGQANAIKTWFGNGFISGRKNTLLIVSGLEPFEEPLSPLEAVTFYKDGKLSQGQFDLIMGEHVVRRSVECRGFVEGKTDALLFTDDEDVPPTKIVLIHRGSSERWLPYDRYEKQP